MVFNKVLPLVMTGFLVFASSAYAQNPNVIATPNSSAPASSNSGTSVLTDPVCDSSVFERMKKKAWMEAQRENYINQSIITKPDSVFAQTCYDKQLGNSMKNLGVAEGTGSNSTKAFEDAVAKNGPVAAAFAGVGSGTTIQLTRPQGSSKPLTTEYEATPKASDTFSCDVMQKLWLTAQCGNFSAGNLPTLKEAGSTDADKEARNQPVACTTGKKDLKDPGLFNLDEATIVGMFDPPASFNKADPKLCATRPYSELEALGCKPNAQPGQKGLCWPGVKNGTKNDDGLDVITCQPGCKSAKEGNSLVCVKD